MFHFLGFLFIIIIAILLIGLSIIGTVIRSIFGLGSRRSSNTYRNDNGNYQSGPFLLRPARTCLCKRTDGRGAEYAVFP